MISSFLFALAFVPSFFMADTECPVVSTFGDRRKDTNTFRLVQYNVEWLFIDYYSSANCPGNGCTCKTEADAQTH